MDQRSAAEPGPTDLPECTALVLAGRRPGGDPLAESRGLSHKAFLPVGGEPMIGRVLRALAGSGFVSRVAICIDAEELLEAVPAVVELRRANRLEVLPSAVSPASSVLQALERLDAKGPVLVTTADHPLLSESALRDFWRQACSRSEADLAVGVVGEALVRERFPEVRRTFLPVRGERITGANVFAFMRPGAREAARFWRRTEMHRKQPLRLVAPFGLVTLALFVLRRLDLEAAFARASRALGARVVPVHMVEAECAFDVDRLEHLELVERLLAGARGE